MNIATDVSWADAIIAAIATAAFVMSIWELISNRPKLRVTTQHIPDLPPGPEPEEYLRVHVANIGRQPTTVTEIKVRLRGANERWHEITPAFGPSSPAKVVAVGHQEYFDIDSVREPEPWANEWFPTDLKAEISSPESRVLVFSTWSPTKAFKAKVRC